MCSGAIQRQLPNEQVTGAHAARLSGTSPGLDQQPRSSCTSMGMFVTAGDP